MGLDQKPAGTVLAGGTTGMICAWLLQPFDVVKTRFIGPLSNEHKRGGSSGRLFLQIMKEEGVPGLWKGSGASMLRVGGGAAIYYSTLNFLFPFSHLLSGSKESVKSNSTAIASGVLARSLAAFTMLPVTVVKTRFEANIGQEFNNISYANAVRQIWANEGVPGFYKGLFAIIARDIPYSGLSFLFFIKAKTTLNSSSEAFSDGMSNFIAGAFAGGVATAITHPGEVLKTKMQLDTSPKGVGLVEMSKLILKNEGPLAFLRGFFPRVLKRSLSSAISWSLLSVFLNLYSQG